MRPVDLHTHSTKSDGTCTPAELVRIAQAKGLAAFALTDHDNADGIDEAMEAARGTEVEVIPGIELSTEYLGKDIHIVGLFYDYQSSDFRLQVREFADQRDLRNQKMCAKLAEDGYPITYAGLKARYPEANITRAHFGQYLLDQGAVSSISEAFDKLIGDDCPYFIPREKISPQKAVNFLRQFHGLPILAHPFQYELGDEGLEKLVRLLKAEGLVGIEAYYCKHTPVMTEQIKALAAKYDLLLSGGSDFHGDHKPGLEMGTGYGHLFVPEELLDKMKAYQAKMQE